MRLALALVAVLSGETPPAPPSTPPPRIAEVVFEGASSYEPKVLLDALRLKPGDTLAYGPDAVAKSLEAYYRLEGFMAATVTGRFDPTTGILTLTVDEGRLAALEIEGLTGGAAERARRSLRLEAGQPVREPELWEAMSRLQDESDGAVRPAQSPPYTVDVTSEGPKVTYHLRRELARLVLRGGGPRPSGRYNRVDGFAPGVRLAMVLADYRTYNPIRLTTFAAYGFSAKSLRYSFGIARGIGPRHGLTLGYEFHDLTDTEDVFRRFGLEESPSGVFNSERGVDYFRRKGHEAFAYRKLGPKAQVGLLFRSDNYGSLPVTTKDGPLLPEDNDFNPMVDEGLMRSLVATVRWVSSGRLFETWDAESRAISEPSLYGTNWYYKPVGWRFDASVERAASELGSDFEFTRFIARLRWHRDPSVHLGLDARGLAGLSGGELPTSKQFSLGGVGTLRGYEKKQFEGRKVALLSLEAALYPAAVWPALIGFYDGGQAWPDEGVSAGFKSGAGLGLRWPPTSRRFFVRGDVAWPLNPDPGQAKKARYNLHVAIPF